MEYVVAGEDVGVHGNRLVAGEVDTVSFGSSWPEFEVVNMDGSAAIYFTTDGSEPTVEGANCRLLPASICARTLEIKGHSPEIKLISAGTPQFSVSRVGD